jgi:acyl-CoA hydrolase
MTDITSTHIVLPGQTNHHGTLFGGVALAYMDEAAAIVATRCAKGPVVTAHIDSVDFKAPIKLGEAVEIHAKLEGVGRTSIKVSVDLYGENLSTGERTHCTTARFVMVAVDADGHPRMVDLSHGV